MPGASAATTVQYTCIGAFVAVVMYAVLYFGHRFFISGFRARQGGAADAELAAAAPALPGPVQSLGLRADDVAVLPTFTYRAAASPGSAKAAAPTAVADCCAVCLDELRDGALVRMLPSCKHYFHAGCVDVWLLSHATCPVCRGSPGQEKVRLGVASLSPPLLQLRRCGVTPPPTAAETSGAKHAVSSRSPSPVRSPIRFELTGNVSTAMSPSPVRSLMRFELVVASMGNGSTAMSPSPTRTRTPEDRICSRTGSSWPVTTSEPHGVQVGTRSKGL